MSADKLLSRRLFLRSAAVGGSGLLVAYFVGCGDGGAPAGPTPASSPTGESPPETPPAGETPAATPDTALGWAPVQASGDLPPPRLDHSLVTDGQSLYMFGGRGPEQLDDLWRFDLATSTWERIDVPSGPSARFGHNAIYDSPSERIIVFGGQAGADFFNDVWAFDLPTGEWAELATGADEPAPRYGAASALDPAGRLLVSHGFTNAGRFDDTWALPLDSESWVGASPEGERPLERCLVRAAWDRAGGRLLMFGGQSNPAPFLDDLWELGDGGWRELAVEPRPPARNLYAMAFDEAAGRLVLFGGSTEDGPANDLWFFDSAGGSWEAQSPAGEAPSPRFGHDAVWLPEGSLIVFGGRDGSQDLNDLWRLTLPA